MNVEEGNQVIMKIENELLNAIFSSNPYKLIYDRGKYCEIVILNEKKQKFHRS